MKPNFAPGIDGFTVKFLRTFWPVLAPLITVAVTKKKNSQTHNHTAIMKLLQKGNKDSTNPNSFRPIHPQSVIYKIASCAISNRIKKTLPVIIGKQQKACVPKDNIGSCLLNLLSTIQHCNKNRLDDLLLLIDFRKDINSIDHSFISKNVKSLQLWGQYN